MRCDLSGASPNNRFAARRRFLPDPLRIFFAFLLRCLLGHCPIAIPGALVVRTGEHVCLCFVDYLRPHFELGPLTRSYGIASIPYHPGAKLPCFSGVFCRWMREVRCNSVRSYAVAVCGSIIEGCVG